MTPATQPEMTAEDVAHNVVDELRLHDDGYGDEYAANLAQVIRDYADAQIAKQWAFTSLSEMQSQLDKVTAENTRLKLCLATINDFPYTAAQNMDAANMAKIARAGLGIPVAQSAPDGAG